MKRGNRNLKGMGFYAALTGFTFQKHLQGDQTSL
jgi:hypothetical protein